MDGQAQRTSYWIYCPMCHSKTRIKVCADTVLLNFPLYCPKCKETHQVSIVKLKMVLTDKVGV